MNIRPAPPVPGKTESERMDNAIQKMFSTSKEEMERREAEMAESQQQEEPQDSALSNRETKVYRLT